jgi:hypothetical protein
MKFNYKTIFLSIIMLSVSLATFATDEIPEPPEETDPPAPINTQLIWLAIVAIAFAYYQINTRRKRV